MNKILYSLVALFLLTSTPGVKADENSSPIWTEAELGQLQQEVKNSSQPGDEGQATEPTDMALDFNYIFYCQSQSYASGLWYYWYSYNLAVARYNALALCVRNNGYTCNVYCR